MAESSRASPHSRVGCLARYALVLRRLSEPKTTPISSACADMQCTFLLSVRSLRMRPRSVRDGEGDASVHRRGRAQSILGAWCTIYMQGHTRCTHAWHLHTLTHIETGCASKPRESDVRAHAGQGTHRCVYVRRPSAHLPETFDDRMLCELDTMDSKRTGIQGAERTDAREAGLCTTEVHSQRTSSRTPRWDHTRQCLPG